MKKKSKKQTRSPRVAIVLSEFNERVTLGLFEGAQEVLKENGIAFNAKDLIKAPGAFEIPLLAQALAQTRKYDGIICLGCVIKGDTAHFEFISLGATVGMIQAQLTTSIPISFGILTTYSDAQAEYRSRPGSENKGREAASACLASIRALKEIRSS